MNSFFCNLNCNWQYKFIKCPAWSGERVKVAHVVKSLLIPGVHEWTPHIPDLTPCGFFLWAWAKEQVYCRKLRTLEKLIETITNVVTNISECLLRPAMANMPVCLRKCGENAGAHVEF